MKYADGQSVALGDRVKLWDNLCGTVVCSIDTGEFTKEYTEAEWAYLKSGVIVKADSGEVFHYAEPDEDFELLSSDAAS
jgi:hypothetical protein